jgi:hypothetical protein
MAVIGQRDKVFQLLERHAPSFDFINESILYYSLDKFTALALNVLTPPLSRTSIGASHV